MGGDHLTWLAQGGRTPYPPPPRVRPDLNRVRRVETTQGSAIRFLSFLEISDGCDACYGER
jgi:hypothetical protein